MNVLSPTVTDQTSKCPKVDDLKAENNPSETAEKKRKIVADTQGDSTATKAKRCHLESCKKKLSIVDLSIGFCKCKQNFCQKHYSPYEHTCSFDYRKESQAILEKKLVKVDHDKMKERL